MNWIRKILGFNHPERITMELIDDCRHTSFVGRK